MARTLTVLALLLSCVLPGCSGPQKVDYAREYPAETPVGPTLDIQLIREPTHVRLINTSAQSFGPSTIWLNQWAGRPIEGLAIGESLRLPLSEFRDHNSIAFRGGGFFATRAAERLACAHLETAEGVYGLVVISERDR